MGVKRAADSIEYPAAAPMGRVRPAAKLPRLFVASDLIVVNREFVIAAHQL